MAKLAGLPDKVVQRAKTVLKELEEEAALGRAYLKQLREEAVRLGLIDEIGGLSDALACLHQMMDEQKTGSAAE